MADYQERKRKAMLEIQASWKAADRRKEEEKAAQAARRADEEALALQLSVEALADEAPEASSEANLQRPSALSVQPCSISPPLSNHSQDMTFPKRKRAQSESTEDSEPLFNSHRRSDTPASLASESSAPVAAPAHSRSSTAPQSNRSNLTTVELEKISSNAPALQADWQNTLFVTPEPDSYRRAKKMTKKAATKVTTNTGVSAAALLNSSDSIQDRVSASDSTAIEVKESALTREPPAWYNNMSTNLLNKRKKEATYGARETKLGQIKTCIEKCKAGPSPAGLRKLFDDMRLELHQMAFIQVDEVMLRKKHMLHKTDGLPQIFDPAYAGGVDYPPDIKADALEQYNRWHSHVFTVDLLRGTYIDPKNKKKGKNTRSLDPSYPGRVLANYYGQGDLVNGQWWPTQLCTVRDGAHGATQGGIFASAGKPAYSVVVAGGGTYNDMDDGDEIWYSGTDGKDGKVSENTASLIENVKKKIPVRVIRSQNAKDSAFRPQRGYRYDGLYDVLSFTVSDPVKQAHLFHLRRQPGQDPIRYQGLAARPTAEEVHFYDQDRTLYVE